jgi:hypothetical protein
MNNTVLTLLSALAIYGLTSFAMPRGGSDMDDDITIVAEDSDDLPRPDDSPEERHQS